MPISGSIRGTSSIGSVTVGSPTNTTIANINFRPKPNVSLAEISDVTTAGVEDGYTLIFNSSTGKYEAKALENVSIASLTGGTF